MPTRLTRRSLLGASLAIWPAARAALAQPPAGAGQAAPPAQGSAPAGFVVRGQDPLNLESPPDALRQLITPTDRFYVRNHFAEPVLDPATWRLKIEGAIDKPIELGLRELMAMPSRSQTSMLECAGNGRVFLEPKVSGVQWLIGAAGNAEWTGVPLASVLQQVGVKADAVDVVFEGADHGELKDEPRSPGDITFARSIPVSLARSGNVLLAHKMNGADLTRAHGYPLRVIVPGWYGMASVKWLSRILITNRPYHGFFQSLQYTHWERPNGAPTLVPVTEMQVKSIIVDPQMDGSVAAGRPFTVRGLAWTGRGTVVKVEVSVDGGRSWSNARLTSPASEGAWRAWEFEWAKPTGDTRALMARATDSQGRQQPLERDADRRTYEISHVVPIPIRVS